MALLRSNGGMRGASPAERLLSSAEVARALGVGVSSIKRWTDEGALKSVRTPGGHRRYDVSAVRAFAERRGFSTDQLPTLPAVAVQRRRTAERSESARKRALLGALRAGDRDVAAEILGRAEAVDLDRIAGSALESIGKQWAAGRWDIDEEHRAAYVLTEVIDALRPEVGAGAPRALLGAPPDELHELPLRMVRLLLERVGWRVDYLGAAVPWPSLHAAVERIAPRLVLLSARSAAPFKSAEFDAIVAMCATRETRVGIGGWWARGGASETAEILRFRTLRGFDRWLRSADGDAARGL